MIFGSDGKRVLKPQSVWGCIVSSTAVVFTVKKNGITRRINGTLL